ncbi:hypothetical protein EDB85DRAFT_1932807 [Lactarius pseudohatsudake]|nr:hypothetical protein EDB85DRAFT_1932807 [Lactarius pseudohatsudake]
MLVAMDGAAVTGLVRILPTLLVARSLAARAARRGLWRTKTLGRYVLRELESSLRGLREWRKVVKMLRPRRMTTRT